MVTATGLTGLTLTLTHPSNGWMDEGSGLNPIRDNEGRWCLFVNYSLPSEGNQDALAPLLGSSHALHHKTVYESQKAVLYKDCRVYYPRKKIGCGFQITNNRKNNFYFAPKATNLKLKLRFLHFLHVHNSLTGEGRFLKH